MITLILAQDEEGGIGKNNDLPWPRIKEDMKYFRDKTKGHAVIMGRKTFESMGSIPLTDRLNIVLSSNFDNEACEPVTIGESTGTYLSKVNSITKAFAIANAYSSEGDDTFVIGGAEIYNLTLRYADRILLTKVVGTFDADTFVNLGLAEWTLDSSEDVERDGKVICTFQSYTRPNSADRVLQ